MVRAKYAIGHINTDHRQPVVSAHPVSPKSKYEPDGSEENQRFWRATPSGVLRLTYLAIEEVPELLTVGRRVYIDFAPDPTGEWQAGDMALGHGGRLTFRLTHYGSVAKPAALGFVSGEFEAQIDNHVAVRMLLPAILSKFEATLTQREAKDLDAWDTSLEAQQRWSVTITPAE